MKIVKTRPKPFTLEPPAQPAQPAPKPARPFMSADIHIKHDGTNPTPPRRGPQAGHAMNDIDVLAAYATPEELQRWRRELEERRAKDQGTWRWQRCDHCGLVIKVRPDEPEGAPCVMRCNTQRRQDSGHLCNMTEKETNDYLFAQAKREKAEIELTRQRAYRAANAERAQRGDPPMTFEEFRKQAESEYRLMIERQRELGAIATRAREELEERRRQQAAENAK
jgi:hypothetical protein